SPDAVTGARGLSLECFPFAGALPSSLFQVAIRASDGQVHTGNGIADSAGYAEARVPITVAAPHAILRATYYPGGSTSGPATSIAPTSITPTGIVDASFPGGRCDRDATLALVPKQTGGS